MKVDMDLQADFRPALLRALVFFNAPDNLGIPRSWLICVGTPTK